MKANIGGSKGRDKKSSYLKTKRRKFRNTDPAEAAKIRTEKRRRKNQIAKASRRKNRK